jgi:hypothetical protein
MMESRSLAFSDNIPAASLRAKAKPERGNPFFLASLAIGSEWIATPPDGGSR